MPAAKPAKEKALALTPELARVARLDRLAPPEPKPAPAAKPPRARRAKVAPATPETTPATTPDAVAKSLSAGALAKIVRLAGRHLAAKSMPILSSVLLTPDVSGEGATLSWYDLENGGTLRIGSHVAARPETGASIALNAANLSKILDACAPGKKSELPVAITLRATRPTPELLVCPVEAWREGDTTEQHTGDADEADAQRKARYVETPKGRLELRRRYAGKDYPPAADVGETVTINLTEAADGEVTALSPETIEKLRAPARPDRAALAVGTRTVELAGMTADEFPALPKLPREGAAVVYALPALKRAWDYIAPAVATDETRYNLNGGYFDGAADGRATSPIVATDGHRLHLADGLAPLGKKGVIVPVASLDTLFDAAKLIGATQVEARVTDASVVWTLSGQLCGLPVAAELVGRLIDGQFPDYTQIVPTGGGSFVWQAPVGEVVEMTKAVEKIGEKGAGGFRFDFAPGGPLRWKAENPDLGRLTDELPGREVTACDHERHVGLNARYLREACALDGAREVTLTIDDELSPVVVRSPETPEFVAVIMPMRI